MYLSLEFSASEQWSESDGVVSPIYLDMEAVAV